MYEPQHFVDLEDNASYRDQKSWLSGEDHSLSPALHRTQSSLSTATVAGTSSNVDRVLFNDLVEIVPLVQSLIDRKANSSFTRRGSVIYTKTPAKKITEPKGRNTAAQSLPGKKRRDHTDKDQGKNASTSQDGCSESFSIFSSGASPPEMDREELVALREQVGDLQRKLLEKDELLKSAEITKTEMMSVHAKLEELKLQAVEKDSLIKSTQLQLSDAKIKLADKQAAMEKLQWEALTSSRKVEKLQEDLGSVQGEISSFISLFEGLTKNDSAICVEDYDVTPYYLNNHTHTLDHWDEMEMQRMEEAREAYIAAVAAAKEKQDEESITAAASARFLLQSFVCRTDGVSVSTESP